MMVELCSAAMLFHDTFHDNECADIDAAYANFRMQVDLADPDLQESVVSICHSLGIGDP